MCFCAVPVTETHTNMQSRPLRRIPIPSHLYGDTNTHGVQHFLKVIFVHPIKAWPSVKGTVVDLRRTVPIRTIAAMRRVAYVPESEKFKVSQMSSAQHKNKVTKWNASQGQREPSNTSDISQAADAVAGAHDSDDRSTSVGTELMAADHIKSETDLRDWLKRALETGIPLPDIDRVLTKHMTNPSSTSSSTLLTSPTSSAMMTGKEDSDTSDIAAKQSPSPSVKIGSKQPNPLLHDGTSLQELLQGAVQDASGIKDGKLRLPTVIRDQLMHEQKAGTLGSLVTKTGGFGFAESNSNTGHMISPAIKAPLDHHSGNVQQAQRFSIAASNGGESKQKSKQKPKPDQTLGPRKQFAKAAKERRV